jgi:hypothetical protein
MNILNRPVTERQSNDCFRLPRELPPIEIGVHDEGVYQETSMNPLREPNRYRKLLRRSPVFGRTPVGLRVARSIDVTGNSRDRSQEDPFGGILRVADHPLGTGRTPATHLKIPACATISIARVVENKR